MSSRTSKPRAVRQSWAAYDALIEKAFAKHDTPPMTPESTIHPLEPDEVLGSSLDPLWERVWELKSKTLDTIPSKVKSLEGAGRKSTLQRDGPSLMRGCVMEPIQEDGKSADATRVAPEAPRQEEPTLKRKASAIFQTSADNRFVTATFDMAGVRREDMHVSFHTTRLVVTWRRVKTTEHMERGVLVRERKDKQYTQTIPLPDGTDWAEIRASRDGHNLIIRYPNMRCIRVEQRPKARRDGSRASSSTACSDEQEFQTCKLAPSTLMEVFEVDKA